MKTFNYINGIKTCDKEYFNILDERAKEVWCNSDNKPEFFIQVLDDLDYIECCRPHDRTDDIWCYLYINIREINICDIIRFAELVGVDYKKIEIRCNENTENSTARFEDEDSSVYVSLFWIDSVVHP